MATPKPRGGYAAPVKPGKKAWKKPANWAEMTQARWLKNHPQPLFPSTDVTGKEERGLMGDARQQVTRSYAATPLPSLQNYLQPFADAQARNAGYAANADAYLQSATAASQNISGAFNQALTNGVNAGAAAVQGQGGSGLPGAIPTAQQALIPASMTGSSFTQFLNASRPAVQASFSEANQGIGSQRASALTDYRDTEAKRRAEVQDAIQQVYKSSLDTLINQKSAANKAAVTEYLALGKTAYQKAQLAGRTRHDRATEATDAKNATTAATRAAETKSYHQASLDAKRTAASAKGVDLAPAYKILFNSTTTPGAPAPGGKVGPDGQRGRWYIVTPLTKLASGGTIEGKATRQFVKYGETVPQTVPGKQRVAKGDYEFPKSTSASTTNRKATASSWDRAYRYLQAKYPGQNPAYLKSMLPARPAK